MDKVKLSSAYGEMKKDVGIQDCINVLKHLVICLAATSDMKIEDKSAEFNEGFQAGIVTIGRTLADVINDLERMIEDGIEQA